MKTGLQNAQHTRECWNIFSYILIVLALKPSVCNVHYHSTSSPGLRVISIECLSYPSKNNVRDFSFKARK